MLGNMFCTATVACILTLALYIGSIDVAMITETWSINTTDSGIISLGSYYICFVMNGTVATAEMSAFMLEIILISKVACLANRSLKSVG